MVGSNAHKQRLGKSLFVAFLLASITIIAPGRASAATVTFDVNFENPPYTLGAVQGQDGWTGFGTQNVSNSLAHTGTQSLNTTTGDLGGGFVTKLLAAGGDYSNPANWYFETWAYVLPGSSSSAASFVAGTGLGATFYISIHGDGAIDYHSGGALTSHAANPAVLNQWLRLLAEHDANDPILHMSVVGTGVTDTFNGSYAGQTPGQISVNGPTAYWDDMKVVTGAVPEPSTALLLGIGIITGVLKRRQHPSPPGRGQADVSRRG